MTVRTLLSASVLIIMQIMPLQLLQASGDMVTYATEYPPGYAPKVVYKSVDSDGKVTYSSTRPVDTATTERIALKPGPSEKYVENTRLRHDKISEAAEALSAARQKREAKREAEEKKRLEKLALLRSIRPQIHEKTVYVGWYPRWRSYPHGYYQRYPNKYPSHPHHGPGQLRPWPLHSGAALK